MEDQTLEIVSQVGEADLGLRPLEPDGTDEQAYAILLLGEDVLHMRTDH